LKIQHKVPPVRISLKSSKIHTRWIFFYDEFGYSNEKPDFSHFFLLEKYINR